jgi:hypothetical protein
MNTFDEERQEVWASILEATRHPHTGTEHAAARAYLLRHILGTALPPSRRLRYDGLHPGGDPCPRTQRPLPPLSAFPPSDR